MWSRPPRSSAWSEISVGRKVPCFVRQVSLIVDARPCRRTRSRSSLSSGSSAGECTRSASRATHRAYTRAEAQPASLAARMQSCCGSMTYAGSFAMLEDRSGDEIALVLHRRHPACETAADSESEISEPLPQEAAPGG